MRFAFGLGLLLLECVACEPPSARPSPEDAARAAQRQQAANERALEEEDKRRLLQAEKARDEAIARDVARNEERARAKERAREVERQRVCLIENEGRKARLAELEPVVSAVRERRETAAATRAADESWVREHCIWENDPRYAVEVRRRASPKGSSTVRYEVNERFVGYSSSAPICPRETSKGKLAVAADIANNLASNGRLVIKNSDLTHDEAVALSEHEELSGIVRLCEDVTNGKVRFEPDGNRSVVREGSVPASGARPSAPSPPSKGIPSEDDDSWFGNGTP